jgi:hypothetical protein
MNEKQKRFPPRQKRPPGILFSDVPGLMAALNQAREEQFLTRENSLLGLTYDLCGMTLRTMTVRDYVLLERFKSPFTNRLCPTDKDLALFLWVLSPQFQKWCDRKFFGWLQPVAAFLHGWKVKRRYCRNMPESSEPIAVKCFEYIDTMFFDAPPAMRGGGVSCLSYLTGWFDALQSEYTMSNDDVWNMGLPELFQRLNAIRQRKNPEVPSFNKGTDNVQLWLITGLREKQFTEAELRAGKVKIPDFKRN